MPLHSTSHGDHYASKNLKLFWKKNMNDGACISVNVGGITYRRNIVNVFKYWFTVESILDPASVVHFVP